MTATQCYHECDPLSIWCLSIPRETFIYTIKIWSYKQKQKTHEAWEGKKKGTFLEWDGWTHLTDARATTIKPQSLVTSHYNLIRIHRQRCCIVSDFFKHCLKKSPQTLKQHRFITLQSWKSDFQNHFHSDKIKVLRDVFPCRGLRAKSIPLSCLVPRVWLHSCPHGPFLHLQSQQSSILSPPWLLLPCVHLLSLILTLLPPSYKDPGDYIGQLG